MNQRLMGAGMLRRAKRDSSSPYTLRVVRDHGEGLWTLESDDGQLFLAVLSRSNTVIRRGLEEKRRADGSAYGARVSRHVRALPDP